jgi:hypothetical protein
MKDSQERLGQGAGFLGATGVGHRLPAAGLVRRKLDLKFPPLPGRPIAAVFLQNLNRRQAHLGEKLVDVARNKQSNSHESLSFRGATHSDVFVASL